MSPAPQQVPLIVPELVALDASPGKEKKDVIEFLASVVAGAGHDGGQELDDVLLLLPG